MRTHEKTHPWITFRLDLNQANHKVWLLLGEAQSKTQHIAGVPLLPSVAKHLQQVYLAKGVQATTAIEGNTLSDEEVLQRVKGELELPLSKEYLGQEIDNIVDVYNLILNRIMTGESPDLSVESIKDNQTSRVHGAQGGAAAQNENGVEGLKSADDAKNR